MQRHLFRGKGCNLLLYFGIEWVSFPSRRRHCQICKMSYSFKKTLFAEILKVKRHLLPCHHPDKLSFVLGTKKIRTCDQIMSAIMQLH